MTLLEEAKEHVEKMKAHTDCCGMPIFRRMVVEIEDMQKRLDRWEPKLNVTMVLGPTAIPLGACIHCRQKPCACAVAQTKT